MKPNNIVPLPLSVRAIQLGALQVVRSPLVPRSPKIAVRDIRLKDGTRLLSPEFLERENLWWRERFGDTETAYRSGDTVFVSPATYERLQRHIDAEIARTIHGASGQTETPTGLLTAERVKPKPQPNADSVTYPMVREGYLRHMRGLLLHSAGFPPVA